MTRKIYYTLAVLALFIFANTVVYSQITTIENPILAWQFATGYSGVETGASAPNTSGKEITVSSTTTDPNLEISILKRGTGVGVPTGNNVRTFNGNFPDGGTKVDALGNSRYYEFSIQAKEGYKVSLNTLVAVLRRVASSPNAYRWMYSVNEMGTADEDKSFTEIGAADVAHNATTAGGNVQPSIDMSVIPALQDVEEEITFRLYAWGATAADASFAIGKSNNNDGVSPNNNIALAIAGTVVPLTSQPVTLTSFTAKNENNTVKLNWVTASEQNNSHFEVFRISENKETQVIGAVSGNGTSSVTNNYSFTDYNPVSGVNYYQLKQVDNNGNSELSNIISINTSIKDNAKLLVTVAENNVNLVFSQAVSGSAYVCIRSVDGKELLKQSIVLNAGYNNITLPVNLQKGIYVAAVTGAAGEYLSAKFIK